MQALAIRSELSAALALASKVTPKKDYPVGLANVALVERDGILTVRGSDLDREISIRLDNSPADTGFAVAIPAHPFKDAEKKAPDAEEIKIRASIATEKDEATVARLAFGKLVLAMNGLPLSGYIECGAPVEMSAPIYSDFTISRDDMATMIGKVAFAISTEATRYYLNGIFMHCTEAGELTFVATDGHRLALHKMAAPEGVTPSMPGVIIPLATVGTLLDLCKAKGLGDSFRVEVNSVKVRFTIGNVTLVSKLIDGTFPDYQRVIPRRNDKTLTASVEDAVEAVQAVSIISSERGRAVKMSIGAGTLTFSVHNPDTGRASQEIAAEWDNHPDFETGFNARYLLDILARVSGERFTMKLSDYASPMLLEDGNSLFVLMPLRV